MITTLKNLGLLVPTVVYMYTAWILLHYISSHLYPHLCTPLNIYGFITTPFTITLPHCQALRWIIYNSGEKIINMWLLLGAWFILYLQKYG